MTKKGYCELAKSMVKLNQDLKEECQKHIQNIPRFYLTYVLGRPPVQKIFNYSVPLSIYNKMFYRGISNDELLTTIPWEFDGHTRISEEKKNKNDFLELLTFCPLVEEVEKYREILQTKKSKYTLINKLQNQSKNAANEKIINNNLKQNALDKFLEIVKNWHSKMKFKKRFEDIQECILNLSFAPSSDDTLANAYEKLIFSLRLKNFQYYSLLINDWRRLLCELIFKNSNWSPSKQDYFLSMWEKFLLGKSVPPQMPLNSRWQSTQSMDCLVAGRIIKYFIDSFINKGKKVDAQIACVLWVCLAMGKHQIENRSLPKLETVINLKKDCLLPNEKSIFMDGNKINISNGLYILFKIFISIEYGKRGDRVFPDVTLDKLEDAVRKTSQLILGDSKRYVSPQAFLTDPHTFPDIRVPPKLLQGMRNQEEFSLLPGHRIGMVLKPFGLPIHK
ncbi:hypothetical protein N9Y92_00460 [Chlamydiales bacterium]|nr:hypothetical protein [Chlamydiales bacterium]